MDLGEASAWVFSRVGEPMALRRVALGAPGPGELLVRVAAATVCGSDLHTLDGVRAEAAAPLVLGHEGCGEVLARGEGAPAAAAVGARVTWSVAASCGACAPCARLGLPQKCATALLKYGHAAFGDGADARALSGTYATHVLLRRGTAVVALPDRVPDAAAAPANCALATMCAALRAARRALGGAEGGGGGGGGQGEGEGDVLRGASVLVQGCGMLGLYGVALAARAGAARIVATDVSPARLELARAFGATLAVDLSGDAAAVQAQLLGGGGRVGAATDEASEGPFLGYDVALEVCGVVAAVRQAVPLLRPGGALVLVGLVHPRSDLGGLTAEALIRKCATLVGVHNYAPRDLEEAVRFLDERAAAPGGAALLARLTSAPVPLARLAEALELARGGAFARVLLDTR